MKKILPLIVTMLVLSGCATVKYRVPALTNGDIQHTKGPYPAVQVDAGLLAFATQEGQGCEPGFVTLIGLGVMLDFPFSFLIDTICMPYDIWKYYLWKNQ